MAKTRKRRPGGGRKPKGTIRGKSETFTTRITPEIRQGIEREAEGAGQSISQAAERLLWLGLETKRRRNSNPPIRALCFLIEIIAAEVSATRGWDLTKNRYLRHDLVEQIKSIWLTDPYRYRIFQLAVSKLLDALKPKGEIRYDLGDLNHMDPTVADRLKDISRPEKQGGMVFSRIWENLTTREKDVPFFDFLRSRGRPESEIEMFKDELYGMDRARRDLGIDAKGGDQ